MMRILNKATIASGILFFMLAFFSLPSYAGICVSNHVNGNLYLKVGADGGGLSEGFTGYRCWSTASQLTIYSCDTAEDGALCVHLANVANTSLTDPTHGGAVKVTGHCLSASSINYVFGVNNAVTIHARPNMNVEVMQGSGGCYPVQGGNLTVGGPDWS